jgi:para-nitrobenzyl esterase
VCGLTGVGVNQWLGIPYAAPPVGQLRWHSPEPHAAWSDPLQAVTPGSAGPQTGGASPSTNEDCLFLNVTVPTGVGPGPLPVLVYIHGGGFQSGDTSLYPEMQLATQGHVIVVGIQYRLGVLGFLADAAFGRHAGDYGLEDQQAALRWVQRNIAAFGGDPNDTTVMGSSAGASSVCDQIVSRGAAGLFERAISISSEYNSLLGAPTSLQPQDCKATLPTEGQADASGATFAASLGCSTDVAACLRAVPVPTLLATAGGTNSPIVNGTTLDEQLLTSFAKGRVNQVSAILGVNRDEDLTGTATTPAAYQSLIQTQYGAAASRILALYPLARFPSPFVASRTVAADSNTVCPALTRDQLLSHAIPVYAYEGDNADMPLTSTADITEPQGSYHDWEPGLLFPGNLSMGITTNLDADQAVLASQLIDQFSAFARTGNPTTTGTPLWPQFTRRTGLLVMSLQPAGDSELTSAAAISFDHNCGFWDKLANQQG